MHSLWLDIGLVLVGAALATVIICCFLYAHRQDKRELYERKCARLEKAPPVLPDGA
jgi:hypothetical protein